MNKELTSYMRMNNSIKLGTIILIGIRKKLYPLFNSVGIHWEMIRKKFELNTNNN
jgi:hypothetical protein